MGMVWARRGQGLGKDEAAAREEEVERKFAGHFWWSAVAMVWRGRDFGACIPAAALKLKVAQAAFSKRAPRGVRAEAECACRVCRCVVASARA